MSAIEAKQYDQAITLLQSYLARAKDTDAYAENWIAYSYRKSGQLDQAFLHYDKALKIDPQHRGAHSYLGEAYLMAGNVPKAEEHLKILDKLCFLPCDEYTRAEEGGGLLQAERPGRSEPASRPAGRCAGWALAGGAVGALALVAGLGLALPARPAALARR